MTVVNVSDDLITRWWEYHRLARGTREERKALESGKSADVVVAKERVDELVELGEPDVIDLLEALIDNNTTDATVAVVGAGPLEDLIHEHGDALVEPIVAKARQSRSFAQALSSVWLERAGLSPETVTRLSPWVKVT